MSAVSGYYTPAGQGWRLAYSLVTLAHELAAVYGDQLTCLGTVGDASHQSEDLESDHNPFILDPNAPGIGIVRAIDFGGSDALLMSIREHIWTLYATTDSRVYEYGYSKGCSDNLINGWGLPFSTHVDTGDAGHLHVSVTQVNGYAPSPSGYVPAIDSTAPWGFTAPVPQGGGTPIRSKGVYEVLQAGVGQYMTDGHSFWAWISAPQFTTIQANSPLNAGGLGVVRTVDRASEAAVIRSTVLQLGGRVNDAPGETW